MDVARISDSDETRVVHNDRASDRGITAHEARDYQDGQHDNSNHEASSTY